MFCTKWHLTKSMFELLKKVMLYSHCFILVAVRVRALVSLFLSLRTVHIDVLIHSVRCCSFSQRRINRKLRVVGAFYRTTRGWGIRARTDWLNKQWLISTFWDCMEQKDQRDARYRLHLMTHDMINSHHLTTLRLNFNTEHCPWVKDKTENPTRKQPLTVPSNNLA